MNPYQPPEASLDDPVAPKIDRPPEVSRACRILWVTLAIGLLSMLPAIRGDWWQPPEMGEDGIKEAETVFLISIILIAGIVSAAYSVLIWMVGRRHNWARWTLLAFLIFGWYSTTNELSQTFSETPFAAVIDLLCIAAEIWAAYLLFFGPGGRWFKAAPPAAQSSPRM